MTLSPQLLTWCSSVPAVRYRPGGYYSQTSAPTVTTQALVADTAYACPIEIHGTVRISELVLLVGTSVAGISGLSAAYAPDPLTSLPGQLIRGSSVPFDCGLSAGSDLLADFSSNPFFVSGFFWHVTVFNGAAQPRTMGTTFTNGAAHSFLPILYGGPTAGSTIQPSVATTTRVTAPLLYATALAGWPASITGWTAGTGTPGNPVGVWRHA